jgi:hypothetical protein
MMQEHKLRENEFIHDLIKVKKIKEDLESHINVIPLFSLKSWKMDKDSRSFPLVKDKIGFVKE